MTKPKRRVTMTDFDIKLKGKDVLALLTEDNSMAQLVENVVNQVLESQMTDHLGAEKHEQSGERQGYRNGYRVRSLYTRVGPIHLRVPQTRDGSFSTDIFKRYQRSEQALVSTLMEMCLNGVSSRKVTKITESLCGTSFSKSTVSQLCSELDVRVNAWKNRPLTEQRFPFIIVDALVTKVRRDHAVRSTAVLVAYGVNEGGHREVLDILLADSESEASWEEMFKRLKKRGVSGVDMVVSDAHTGLVSALQKNFQGAAWQRCQTHFIRNILSHTSRKYRKEIAEHLKLVFAAPDRITANRLAIEVMEKWEGKASKAMECLEEGLEDALAVLALPHHYRKRLRTTNLAERMNAEIRRREKAVRIFPNEEAATRLIGAVLAQYHDEWLEGNKYLDMTEYWDIKQQQQSPPCVQEKNNLVSINQ
jgi:transposase-like protein